MWVQDILSPKINWVQKKYVSKEMMGAGNRPKTFPTNFRKQKFVARKKICYRKSEMLAQKNFGLEKIRIHVWALKKVYLECNSGC